MLIAVIVNKNGELTSTDDMREIYIFNRKFNRIRLKEVKNITSNFTDSIKDCKYMISKYADLTYEILDFFEEKNIKIINERRTKDPYYAVRLI